jgi:hypothetical protein
MLILVRSYSLFAQQGNGRAFVRPEYLGCPVDAEAFLHGQEQIFGIGVQVSAPV